MTSFDDGIGRLRIAAGHVVDAPPTRVAGAAGYITGPWDRFTRWLKLGDADTAFMPARC